MKKIGLYFSIFLLSIVVFLFGFNYKPNKQPYILYNVYLDNELIGTIESKEELDEYINSQADEIRKNVTDNSLKMEAINTFDRFEGKVSLGNLSKKEKAKYLIRESETIGLIDIDIDNLNFYLDKELYNYNNYQIQEMKDYIEKNSIYKHVDNVYIPNGIKIKKIYTFNKEIDAVPLIYKKIIEKKSCTIPGYKFTIKSTTEGVDDIIIYTIDKEVFSNAIEDLITIFVDVVEYDAYKNDNQNEIVATGSIIENIYIQQDITYKAINVSVEEKIYTDSTSLAAYLLYGEKFEEKTVKVKAGDSIESISFDNEISVQEFLIFNTQYTSRENLLVAGTDVVISNVDPKIQVVVETYEIVDKETDFSVVEQYDQTLTQGSVLVTQNGQKGLERVTQRVKTVNGQINYVDPIDKETIKSQVPKIINIGTKYVPTIGSIASWRWPTDSGYTITSYYGYRLQVFGEGSFHYGLDIAGTGYGSNVYAANNGVIEIIKRAYDYGNYILINHNNGYYTLYAHMSGFAQGLSVGSTVERGQVIGYVGSTGWSTGPHLHFEVRTCERHACCVNPLPYLSR